MKLSSVILPKYLIYINTRRTVLNNIFVNSKILIVFINYKAKREDFKQYYFLAPTICGITYNVKLRFRLNILNQGKKL